MAITGNTAPASDMSVPQPFFPLGQMVGVGARNKASSTVTSQVESLMETDASTAPVVHPIQPVLDTTPAKPKVINFPSMVVKAGLKSWSDMMLKGHPGGHATNWDHLGKFICQPVQVCCRHYGLVIEEKRGCLLQHVCQKRSSRQKLQGRP